MERVKRIIFIIILLIFLPAVYFGESEVKSEKEAKFSSFLENKNFSDEVIVISLATLPIFELRGAIPWAIHYYNMTWYKTYILAIIGNFLPIPIILLILKYGLNFLSRVPLFKSFFEWIFARTRKKGAIVQKYRSLGLIIFVMIPLPITGAWTGSIAAYLFGINFVPSLICIFIGICLAGVIVTILSLFGILGAVIATLALITIFILWIINNIRKRQIKSFELKGE
ncbi:MAG: small multi-drug export protein [Candidatus Cloacimonetes bacterium]|nr:small multi-drug export protein [Candidatus Cloacimonadota bacterium]MBL7086790.1 small multi-drug export protein [Candidatus Cloacimonadota bacterium]